MPVGTILPYKGAIKDIPEKWALCNGSNGTPNLSGRFLEGVTSSPGSTKSAGLPNITGSLKNVAAGGISVDGQVGCLSARTSNSTKPLNSSAGGGGFIWIDIDASKCSSIYGNSTTVQPASYTVLYIMKIKA